MGSKTFFICSNCGYKTSKWLGKCPECDAWNGFVEEIESEISKTSVLSGPKGELISIQDVAETDKSRSFSGLYEFDRVLGGLVPGQAVLISGEPGIGKSTLVLTIANLLAKEHKVFYINGEESNAQVRVRAGRIGALSKNLFLFPDNSCEGIMELVRVKKPGILVIDSIQTIKSDRYQSLPGSVVQIRESAYQLAALGKEMGIPVLMIGHITKSGSIAGPKVIEHIVDSVLFLETDARGYFRVLRSLKNRFFSTDEVGFFTMEENGLRGVEDVASAFTYRHEGVVRGVSLYPHLEGNRVFPVEVQALCSPSQFNYPRRTADGVDANRLYLLIAIMEKSLGITLASHDVYLNVTNGLKIDDPALDLAAITAIYSSFREAASHMDTAVFGEVGLTGEIRPVLKMEKRAAEMARAGMEKIILPYQKEKLGIESAKIMMVKTIGETVSVLF